MNDADIDTIIWSLVLDSIIGKAYICLAYAGNFCEVLMAEG
jgi:hypothetical protein